MAIAPRQRRDWQGHYVTLLVPVQTKKGRLDIDSKCQVHVYDMAKGTFTLVCRFGEHVVRVAGIQPHLVQYAGVEG